MEWRVASLMLTDITEEVVAMLRSQPITRLRKGDGSIRVSRGEMDAR